MKKLFLILSMVLAISLFVAGCTPKAEASNETCITQKTWFGLRTKEVCGPAVVIADTGSVERDTQEKEGEGEVEPTPDPTTEPTMTPVTTQEPEPEPATMTANDYEDKCNAELALMRGGKNTLYSPEGPVLLPVFPGQGLRTSSNQGSMKVGENIIEFSHGALIGLQNENGGTVDVEFTTTYDDQNNYKFDLNACTFNVDLQGILTLAQQMQHDNPGKENKGENKAVFAVLVLKQDGTLEVVALEFREEATLTINGQPAVVTTQTQ